MVCEVQNRFGVRLSVDLENVHQTAERSQSSNFSNALLLWQHEGLKALATSEVEELLLNNTLKYNGSLSSKSPLLYNNLPSDISTSTQKNKSENHLVKWEVLEFIRTLKSVNI